MATVPAVPGGSTFDPSTLKPPLNIVSKNLLLAYVLAHGYSRDQIAGYVVGRGALGTGEILFAPYMKRNSNSGDRERDQNFIDAATAIAHGGGFNTEGTNPQTKTEFDNPLSGFGKWFGNNLVRLGEIAVGALIVGVGVNAVLKGKR
jgi:hypothetical protein